jgi:hypothetical protein
MAPYRLPDGTPVFHPVGMLPVDLDEDRVCCGLCGEWFRGLATHVRLAHEWSADEYRAEFGLKAQRPLQAPGLSEVQAAIFKSRIQTDRRLQAAMRQGLDLARRGELNELGRQADVRRGRALERRRLTEQQGRRMGESRAPTRPAAGARRARPASGPGATVARSNSASPTRRRCCGSATPLTGRPSPSWRRH